MTSAHSSAAAHASAGTASLTVAVAGASGFLGSALATRLEREGHAVRRIGRGGHGHVDFRWDPMAGRIDPVALDRADVVVNLAGANVGQRWSREHKREILESRVATTALLAKTMAAVRVPPRVFVSMSAIGVYGDRGDTPLDESSPPGRGFLADVVTRWESAASPARDAGVRVVHPRMGVVMNPEGGALAKLLPVFNLGGGGKIGKGTQWMSWIALEDALRALVFLMVTDSLSGPVNVTSPNPVTNAELAQTLGHVLHRPAVATVPEFALKLMYGEMAEETLLTGQRVLPRHLLAAGFRFEYPELEAALRHELGRT